VRRLSRVASRDGWRNRAGGDLSGESTGVATSSPFDSFRRRHTRCVVFRSRTAHSLSAVRVPQEVQHEDGNQARDPNDGAAGARAPTRCIRGRQPRGVPRPRPYHHRRLLEHVHGAPADRPGAIRADGDDPRPARGRLLAHLRVRSAAARHPRGSPRHAARRRAQHRPEHAPREPRKHGPGGGAPANPPPDRQYRFCRLPPGRDEHGTDSGRRAQASGGQRLRRRGNTRGGDRPGHHPLRCLELRIRGNALGARPRCGAWRSGVPRTARAGGGTAR